MSSARRTTHRRWRWEEAGAAAAPTEVPSSRRLPRAGPCRPPEAHFPLASPRHHRSVPRGTDCLPPAGRCSREHLGGARGRDGGDAGVRSCNAKGQGESSRSLASADPRPTSCVGAGCMSRRRRERLWRSDRAAGRPRGSRAVTEMVRRDSVLCLDRPPARIPHAGPGDGPTGARRFVSPRAPVRNGKQGMPRIVARPVGRGTRSDHRTPRVSPMSAIRATHPTRCELHA